MTEQERAGPKPAEAWARAAGEELRGLHAWFRQELAELREEIGAHLDGRLDGRTTGTGRAPSLGRQLGERCLSFCTALDRHHTGEDSVVFPHLEERFPELGQALDRLRREHAVVQRLRDELETLLTDLESVRTHPERLRTNIERLVSELEAHFDYEERQLVAALNSLVSVPWPRP